jgi:F0F1-type ATP synthase assembly protein I
MKQQKQKDGGAGSMTMVARYLGLAFLLPLTAGAGWALGSYLDRTLHTGYWAITCLILGIVGGFIQLIRELLRDSDKQ